MFQDQVIDYDNSLRGLEVRYYINDDMNIFFLGGDKELKYRTLASERTSDKKITSRAFLGGVEVGWFHYLYLYQNNAFDEVELKTYEHNFETKNEF